MHAMHVSWHSRQLQSQAGAFVQNLGFCLGNLSFHKQKRADHSSRDITGPEQGMAPRKEQLISRQLLWFIEVLVSSTPSCSEM